MDVIKNVNWQLINKHPKRKGAEWPAFEWSIQCKSYFELALAPLSILIPLIVKTMKIGVK